MELTSCIFIGHCAPQVETLATLVRRANQVLGRGTDKYLERKGMLMDFGLGIRGGWSLVGLHRSAGLALVLALLSVGLTACESEESNDIAKAQACLDKISGYPNNASECISYVAKYDSQQANIIKCGGTFLKGGMTVQRFTRAYEVLDDNTYQGKEAAMMTLLAMSSGDPGTPSPSTAQEALGYCQRAGLTGMVYLANLSVAGTQMADLLETALGAGFDVNNPSSLSDAELQSLLNDCTNPAGPTGSCASLATDSSTIGNSVIAISSGYCAQSNANQDVCQEINSTISAAGSNPATVGQAVFCYLNGQTWNGTNCI